MISGEYAVLAGAEAIVAAVDRRAYARLRAAARPTGGGPTHLSAEARAAFELVERELGALGSEPAVDVSELRTSTAKLGLGSSAAAAAAATGLALSQHGVDIASESAKRRIFDLAFRGHQAIAPIGSGADVAASVYGGFLKFLRQGDQIQISPLSWPAGLRAHVVWTGQEARTSTFLERVAALAVADPDRHGRLMQDLKHEASRFVRAVDTHDTNSILASTAAYGRAMGALGDAAGIPIVNDTLNKVAQLAERAGGAAKPSGAGGGDVALALFPDEAADQRFRAKCNECNFSLLLLKLGAEGVCSESGPGRGEARA